MSGPYYHFTCDHGREALGADGKAVPASMLTQLRLPWTGFVVWLTDLTEPDVNGLGLTSHFISCDRTAHRYRVTDAREVMPYHSYAHALTREQREEVEATPGARPMHWFVAICGVPVVYDPITADVGT